MSDQSSPTIINTDSQFTNMENSSLSGSAYQKNPFVNNYKAQKKNKVIKIKQGQDKNKKKSILNDKIDNKKVEIVKNNNLEPVSVSKKKNAIQIKNQSIIKNYENYKSNTSLIRKIINKNKKTSSINTQVEGKKDRIKSIDIKTNLTKENIQLEDYILTNPKDPKKNIKINEHNSFIRTNKNINIFDEDDVRIQKREKINKNTMNNNSLLTPEISQLSPFFSKEGNSEKINEDKKDIKNQFSNDRYSYSSPTSENQIIDGKKINNKDNNGDNKYINDIKENNSSKDKKQNNNNTDNKEINVNINIQENNDSKDNSTNDNNDDNKYINDIKENNNNKNYKKI